MKRLDSPPAMGLLDVSEARTAIGEDFALARIVGVEIADDEVVIRARKDGAGGLGYYTLTIRPEGEGLSVGAEVRNEAPRTFSQRWFA
jgi:hypothetical protein